jgi:hypothetical protein
MYRHAAWDKHGRLTRCCCSPVVASTVRSAASSLASSFWHHIQHSPFHVLGSANMQPTLRALLRAYDNSDPAPKCQKAINPKLLRFLYNLTGLATITLCDSAPAVTADIPIAGFFFAMRSCVLHYSGSPAKQKLSFCLVSSSKQNPNNYLIPKIDVSTYSSNTSP